jgi:hypothetical protein
MQAIFSAIYYFFRMGPLGLLVIAILVAAAGYFLQIADNASRADKARALAEGPPPIGTSKTMIAACTAMMPARYACVRSSI